MRNFPFDSQKATHICAGILAGVLLMGALLVTSFGGFSNIRAAMKYAAVLRAVENHYVGEYDLDDLTDAALSAAVDSLDDNWSYYMNADSYAAYQDYAANRYQGIGVTIQKDEVTGGFIIASLVKDGPAQLAGMLEGDIILAVDGEDVTAGDAAYVRELIQADFGKNATVTALRDGERLNFTVSCEAVYSAPVEFELLGSTGYVRIENFREGAAASAIEAVESLREQGAESLVFDVRSNPGGQVSELVDLLDYLLPEGDVFIRADKRGNEVTERSDEACVRLPIAVVINGDSYSAAEFFAAALPEYAWATVVGESSTGKARSQVTLPLRDGSAVHLSKYTYLTPQRNDLYEAGGVTPDVPALLTDEQRAEFDTGWLAPADDPQIQTAIAVVNA